MEGCLLKSLIVYSKVFVWNDAPLHVSFRLGDTLKLTSMELSRKSLGPVVYRRIVPGAGKQLADSPGYILHH